MGAAVSREAMLPHRGLFPGAAILPLPAARRSLSDRPGLVLLAGALATIVLAILELCNVAGKGTQLQDAYVVIAAAAGAIALAIVAHRGSVSSLRYRPLAIAVALTGAAMLALDAASVIGQVRAVVAANLLFVCGTIIAMVIVMPTLYRRLDRQALATAGLDGGIMLSAGVTLVLTFWRTGQGSGDPRQMLVAALAATLFASAGLAAIVAFNFRAAPEFRGVWAAIPAVSVVGLSWIVWTDLVLRGGTRDTLISILYSGGILLLAYAWMTWSDEAGTGQIYERVAHAVVDWLPIGAIVLCVALAAVPHGRIQGLDPAPIGTAVVVFLSIWRQRILIIRERWASHRLAGEVEERAQTMVSLARLEQADTIEQTSYRICDEALRLPGIDAARIYAFCKAGVVPLAIEGVSPEGETLWEPIDGVRATHLGFSSGGGAWIDSARNPANAPLGLLGEAFAPMRWDDRIIGVVSMGTTSQVDADRLAHRLSTLTEFGVVSAALLGPMLVDHWRRDDIRSQLESIIANRAFTPVFQPVVELRSREIVGFEALTRFADGTRPDQRFGEAETAGMSIRLETACIVEQLEAATWLPPGPWLSLNVSPALATAIVPLASVLERADRDVVLEITEHVEIPDYRALVAALDMIRGRARLAVDDAGAGYAGLRHILELRPQFVKLDISLVRNLDTDPARQAMVAGMDHFARNAGCELIAEGIETEGELAQLIHLGITLGQGYLLGKPGPVLPD